MTRICVAPIVEGHGEVESIRTLLERVWLEMVGGDYIRVLRPSRVPKSQLVQPDKLSNAIEFAFLKLAEVETADRKLVFVLFDADEDCPAELVGRLTAVIERRGDVALVIANVEYETWFLAAAESLATHLDVPQGTDLTDPEGRRLAKATLKKWMRGPYQETLDQPSLTHAFDLHLCRRRSRSFNKLCRELERRHSA